MSSPLTPDLPSNQAIRISLVDSYGGASLGDGISGDDLIGDGSSTIDGWPAAAVVACYSVTAADSSNSSVGSPAAEEARLQ